MGLRHLLKHISPAGFALAFLLGGTPNAPIASVLPTVGGCAEATGPGYTGSAGGVSNSPQDCANWYDHSANSWGATTLKFAHMLRDQMNDSPSGGACVDCDAYAEQQDTHTVLAIAMGISGAMLGGPLAPLLAISAGGNAMSPWAYGRAMRLAGC